MLHMKATIATQFSNALRVIEPGEQLFDSYGCSFDDDDIESRQQLLRTNYAFDCKCEACVKKFQSFSDLPLKFFDSKSKSQFNDILNYIYMRSVLMKTCIEMVCLQHFLTRCAIVSLVSNLSRKLLLLNS